MTDKPRIILEGKSLGEYFEQAVENKKLKDKLYAKEKECEELKKLLKVRTEDLCDSCGASSMKLMPCKVYEKTLTEIKEFAETCRNKNIDNCYECKYFDDCEIEDETVPTRDVCKLILTKVNEVLNDRDNTEI